MNVSKRSEFYLGVRAVAPTLIGVIPFGLTFGVLGPEYGFTPIQTFLMSLIKSNRLIPNIQIKF